MISLWHSNSQMMEAGTIVTFIRQIFLGCFLIQQQGGFLHWAHATPALVLGLAWNGEDRRRPWQLCSILGHMVRPQPCPEANTHPRFSATSAWRIASDLGLKCEGHSFPAISCSRHSCWVHILSYFSLFKAIVHPEVRIVHECYLKSKFVCELMEQQNWG